MQVALERDHLNQSLPDLLPEFIFNLLDLLCVDVCTCGIEFLDVQLNLVKLATLISQAALQICLDSYHELPETLSMLFAPADGFHLVKYVSEFLSEVLLDRVEMNCKLVLRGLIPEANVGQLCQLGHHLFSKLRYFVFVVHVTAPSEYRRLKCHDLLVLCSYHLIDPSEPLSDVFLKPFELCLSH